MEQLEEILRQIEQNHHTLKGQIEYVIVKPAERMLNPNSLRVDVPDYESIVSNIQSIYDHAYATLESFANIGKSNESNANAKYNNICKQLKTIETQIIPNIKEIVSSYRNLIDKPIFNLDTKMGLKAYNLVRESIAECDDLCERLISHNATYLVDKNSENEIDLFALVTKVFNTLEANVIIKTPSYSIKLAIDENRFKNEVLLNIYHNIERYAFPRYKYEMVTLLQKRVLISFENIDGGWQIEIANNGEPFKGDISKMFECGYHHGNDQGNGYGMHTAKQYLKSIGGDITMQSSPEEEFKVKFTIKLFEND